MQASKPDSLLGSNKYSSSTLLQHTLADRGGGHAQNVESMLSEAAMSPERETGKVSKWRFWKTNKRIGRNGSVLQPQHSLPQPSSPRPQNLFHNQPGLPLVISPGSHSRGSFRPTAGSLHELEIPVFPRAMVEPIKAAAKTPPKRERAPGPDNCQCKGAPSPKRQYGSIDSYGNRGCDISPQFDKVPDPLSRETSRCLPHSTSYPRTRTVVNNTDTPSTMLPQPSSEGSASPPVRPPRRVYQIPDKPNYFPHKPSLQDFNLAKTIGTGSFGRVYMARVKDRPDVPPVAIKRMTKATIIKQKQLDHVLSEKEIFSKVNHPMLVQMHTTFQDPCYLYIVMEYIEGGEFFTFLRKSKRLENESAKFYAAHITLIFEYLHPLHILYRDLKPENLLIARSGYLKLTDFGFAKIVERRTFTLCGTPEYIAPEVLLNKGHDQAADWWTLGILIYEMLVGYPPFVDEEPLGIYKKILAGKIVFPRFFNKDAKSLVKRLLTHDLARRYGHVTDGVSDVRGHCWFDGLDFEDLLEQKLKPPFEPKCNGLDDTSNFSNYEKQSWQPSPPDSNSLVSRVEAFRDW